MRRPAAGGGAPGPAELEKWLRRKSAASASTAEVNVQLGEMSLCKQPLGPLPPEIMLLPDVVSVFGGRSGAEAMP